MEQVTRTDSLNETIAGLFNDTFTGVFNNTRPFIDTQAVTNVLDHLLDGYNKEIRPDIGVVSGMLLLIILFIVPAVILGERVVIDTSVLIKSMGPFSENDMSYSMQVYFRQRWKDKRLKFFLPNVTEFTLSNKFINNIWKPNSYFINGRRSKQHNITVPNAFVRLSYDGSIYMSVRLTVNARCPMRLSRYPMDKVVCPLFIGSCIPVNILWRRPTLGVLYTVHDSRAFRCQVIQMDEEGSEHFPGNFGYTTDDLVYKWANKVDIDPGVKVSQFELGRIEQQQQSKQGRYGELSILEVYIHMSRAVGFYVLQTYIPCYLMVVISWISFWVNRDAAPARVLLGVTTILSTAAIGMTVREGLPRVPYATALDVFLNVCIVYEMAALIEYAAVNYFTKLMPKEGGNEEEEEETDATMIQKSPRTTHNTDQIPEAETLLLDKGRGRKVKTVTKTRRRMTQRSQCYYCLYAFWMCLVGSSDYQSHRLERANPEIGNSVSTIDIVSRVLFPLTFAMFNLCYWLMYFYLEVS